jgi:muramoyltetrapeptide carboxypeptidase
VALISPSDPAAHLFPERVERAGRHLVRSGIRLVRMPASESIRTDRPYLAGGDAARARDIEAAFDDPSIDGVWAAIGGMNSNRLLDRLDYARLARHPKVIIGYSDLTCLINAIAVAAGMVTFHGPNLVVEWGGDRPDPFTEAALWQVVGRDKAAGSLPHADVTRLEPWPPGTARILGTLGWRGNGAGVAEGALVGGNLQTLLRLAGTPFWPSFDGRVLFWEDVGVPEHGLDAMLSQLRLLGVFDAIRAVVVGKVVDRDEAGCLDPDRTIALVEDVAGRRLPVVAGVDMGHTDPMLTLPIGVVARVDADRADVALLEPAVASPVEGKRPGTANDK